MFAAPVSGRYSFHVEAPRASQECSGTGCGAGAALTDDTAPGGAANDREVDGRLTGSELDALDLYRFTVATRSDLRLRLRTRSDFELTLLGAGASGWARHRDRPPAGQGSYFVAVRASTGPTGPTPSAGSPGRSPPPDPDRRRAEPQRAARAVGPARRGRPAGGGRHGDDAGRALRPDRRLALPRPAAPCRGERSGSGLLPAPVGRSVAGDRRLRRDEDGQPERRWDGDAARHRAADRAAVAPLTD